MVNPKPIALPAVALLITISLSGCLDFLGDGDTGLGQVSDLGAEESTVHVRLEWEEVREADSYHIFRNGEKVAVSESTEYNDTSVERGRHYTYQVCAVREMGPAGKVNGERSEQVTVSLVELSYDLDGFIAFLNDTGHSLKGVLDALRKAGMEVDLTGTRELSETLESLCDRYMDTVQQFHIPEHQEVREEYLAALQDFRSAAQKFQYAVDHFDTGSIDEGQSLVASGAGHMGQASSML
ncbi:MAG: hypothetical protein ACLFPN_02245 [Methanomassiliicoccales archaeon]